MKILFLLLVLFSLNTNGFKLIKLTTIDESDLKKFLVKWDKNIISVGVGIDPLFPSDLSYCPNINNPYREIKEALKVVNNIYEADIELVWSDSVNDHDITIYSYTNDEWNNHNITWNKGANAVAFTSFNGSSCYHNYECYFETVDIRLNCSYLSNSSSSNSIDYQTVVLHEIVHGLGLDHSENPRTLMYPLLSRGQSKRKLHSDDEAGLIFLYPMDGGARFLKGMVCGKVTGRIEYSNLEKFLQIIILLFVLTFIAITKLIYKKLI